ncbi:hypothetical protein FA15DRAFT_662645 [Coprinopsis marcescibilis]|uniref:Alpha/beta-hydrolase n=1 Tax=Coprinopsis marcescibilis TaxID=230819 RepID=A0A5C3LER7_COPMA|nr:hypothetical protein FA15DRAFT_662645 [Coprinopsis marcescibilis]
MRSALSRNHSTTSPSQKAPRKSSSFLSLRREKDKNPSAADVPTPYYDRDAPVSTATPPSSFVDIHLQSLNPRKNRSRRSSPSRPKTATQADFSTISKGSPGSSQHEAYSFPRYDSTEDITPTPLRPTPDQYLRTRSRTGPSGSSRWDAAANLPSLRFSGSSSTHHTETPPRTPDDYTGSTDSLEQLQFPVVVAAPVPGVETMDALVDGMNGGPSDSMSNLSLSSRSRFGIPNHHPLYQPPLPTPPPGVILGGATKPRRHHRTARKPSISSSSSSDEEIRASIAARAKRRNRHTARSASTNTIKPIESKPSPRVQPQPQPPAPSQSPAPLPRARAPPPLPPPPITASITTNTNPPTDRVTSRVSGNPEFRKSIIPSISEIIRTHAPPEIQARMKFRTSSMYTPSQGHGTVHEEPESDMEPLNSREEAEFMSRSSMDSVADEIQRSLKVQNTPSRSPVPPPPSAFMKRQSTFSDNVSLYSPRSDPGANASLYSSSAASMYQAHSPVDSNFLSMVKPSAQQAVAQYLRSTRLTTLVRLTRQPHASQENPLTVSFSDLGSPNGYPVVVFLGLGCVRHIMGLYDEMAECLGLRLITIDRWGLGRTDSRPKSSKGIIQWASAVEEVLDLLRINECSIMAHSAGAPYALSFANKVPSRIRGDVCLLAPWVGGSENSGYRWLKYIPNGILRTAQAAEWKIQAWMIGKPPTIAYEGIGYTAPKKEPSKESSSERNSPSPKANLNLSFSRTASFEGNPRPSIGSGTFSEYDDLNDFDGKFDSRSTLGIESRLNGFATNGHVLTKRKSSRGFLDRLKGGNSNRSEEKQEHKPSGTVKKLKGLRSMGSLKGKSRKAEPACSPLPPTLRIDVGLGLDDEGWPKSLEVDGDGNTTSTATVSPSSTNRGQYLRSTGHRSVSLTSKPAVSLPSSPSPSTVTTSFTNAIGSKGYQAALGNALIAASHAESAKGTHSDLLQILNHDNQPWGFSYAAYPHNVRVWYGDKDEKIAENAVRWMERTMGNDRCSVKVVKGADHGLMYRSSVVVDVLEWFAGTWRGEDQLQEPFAGLRLA